MGNFGGSGDGNLDLGDQTLNPSDPLDYLTAEQKAIYNSWTQEQKDTWARIPTVNQRIDYFSTIPPPTSDAHKDALRATMDSANTELNAANAAVSASWNDPNNTNHYVDPILLARQTEALAAFNEAQAAWSNYTPPTPTPETPTTPVTPVTPSTQPTRESLQATVNSTQFELDNVNLMIANAHAEHREVLPSLLLRQQNAQNAFDSASQALIAFTGEIPNPDDVPTQPTDPVTPVVPPVIPPVVPPNPPVDPVVPTPPITPPVVPPTPVVPVPPITPIPATPASDQPFIASPIDLTGIQGNIATFTSFKFDPLAGNSKNRLGDIDPVQSIFMTQKEARQNDDTIAYLNKQKNANIIQKNRITDMIKREHDFRFSNNRMEKPTVLDVRSHSDINELAAIKSSDSFYPLENKNIVPKTIPFIPQPFPTSYVDSKARFSNNIIY